MAPRKEKSEKSGSDLVLDYLRKQNRPYSATDISLNLHNKVTKTNAAKFLKELHDAKKIEGRAAGKQLVYHALQTTPSSSTTNNTEADTSAQDPAVLDAKTNELRSEITALKATEKALKQELSIPSSIRSHEDLQAEHSALQTQKQILTQQIADFEAANKDVKPISQEEREAIDSEFKKWNREVKLRNDALKNLWEFVLDMRQVRIDIAANAKDGDDDGELSEEELWEAIGCEGPMPL